MYKIGISVVIKYYIIFNIQIFNKVEYVNLKQFINLLDIIIKL